MAALKHFQVLVEEFDSPSLRGNPAGDPSSREVAVIIPKSVKGPADAARFPVVLVLPGFSGTGPMMLNRRAWLPSFPEQLDRLRERGAIGDLIAVLPDAFTVYGGSQYLNSAATGRYRDMLTDDLIPWVDRRFPTLAAARHRAVAGKSSGGYGAITLCMERPDLFAAVACHSGDMYFEYCYQHDFPAFLREIGRHGSLEKFMDAFLAAPKKRSDDFTAMNVVAMSAAYSPNPAKPWRVDLPVDLRTGEIVAPVWARWLDRDPVRMADRLGNGLAALRLVYLECGSRDQFHLQYGMRILSARLRALGVAHRAEEFDDDHFDTTYRYDTSLPLVFEAIRKGD